jgi:leader peptidase (prepilin peptidase) / N-methyltransferase
VIDWPNAVIFFVVGAAIGSFLNVCIARWPRELSVVRPRSRCPSCGHQLAWFENIPLVSWIALRARCRCCDEPISAIYPAIELLVGVVWALCVYRYGATFTALRLGLFLTLLLGVAVTDLQHYLIPDGFTITGLITMLAAALLAPFLGESEIFAGPFDALIGACAGAGLIAIVGWLGEAALGREAMGMGDMTLMAFVGAALGPTRALITVFVGATLGAIAFTLVVIPVAMARRGHVREQTELALGAAAFETPLVPFGVFLAPAALLTLFWGDALLAWLTRA